MTVATQTPTALAVPIAGPSGMLADGWVDLSSLIATLSDTAELTVTGGVAFAYGEIGYLFAADGSVRKTKDDNSTTARCRVICIEALGVADLGTGTFRVAPGLVTGLTNPGSVNEEAYVSNTSGAITNVAPTTIGRYGHCIGWWLSATILVFNPDRNLYPVVDP